MNGNFYGQNYGQYYSPQLQNTLKGRPVSSIEEVRAAQVDFDGSLFIFPDIVNKRIYTKQINIDGTASLNMYELTSIPVSHAADAAWVTRDELEKALEDLKVSLSSKETPKAKPATQVNF